MTDFRFQPKGLKSNLGWYDRGYIPHFEGGEIPQFFTFRLYDSLPASVLKRWREETVEAGDEGKIQFRKNVERYLDRGYGSCFLRDERVARLVQNSLPSTATRSTACLLGSSCRTIFISLRHHLKMSS